MRKTWYRGAALLGAAAALLLCVGTASADIYHFLRISNGGLVNDALGSQLSVDVTAGAQGTVNFEFTNPIGIASSITDIYFDDGHLLAIASLTQTSGVSFQQASIDKVAPPDLPGGSSITPQFNVTGLFKADSNAPTSPNGINAANESLIVNFSLKNNATFENVISDLASGALRIGLHVQSINTEPLGLPSGSSDSQAYVNGGPVVPAPAAVVLGVIGISMIGIARRLRLTQA